MQVIWGNMKRVSNTGNGRRGAKEKHGRKEKQGRKEKHVSKKKKLRMEV